ncbi:MAG: hypothetical protein JWP25_8539 [Bradyrhizobium sp.]|jgi:hypothetical protein|nr:hypothetical protein [Bradyrhizobium sp.]
MKSVTQLQIKQEYFGNKRHAPEEIQAGQTKFQDCNLFP